jgi:hypothetical protein
MTLIYQKSFLPPARIWNIHVASIASTAPFVHSQGSVHPFLTMVDLPVNLFEWKGPSGGYFDAMDGDGNLPACCG